MKRLPIRIRITLAFATVMATVLAGVGLFLYLRLESELDDSIDQTLHSRAGELTRLIRVNDAGLGESAREFLRDRGGDFAQVLTASGRMFDPSAQPTRRPVLSSSEVGAAERGSTLVARSGVPGLGSGPARLLATAITFEGQRLIVVTGESLADRNATLGNLATLLLIGGPVALLLASLAAYGSVAAALRPVEEMRSRAAQISAADTDQRLPVPIARDELHRLGETLNGMLARLDAALERERRFVDEASHELRTPLALHKTELELALRYEHDPEPLRVAIASAIEEVDRLIALAEDLLVLARSEGGEVAVNAQPLELEAVLSSVNHRFANRAEALDRRLVVEDADGVTVEADRALIERALTNLVDNALNHGGGEVRVSAQRADGRVELHVLDRGTGFPPDFIDRAFERFSRAHATRARGAGLGLAIVDVIARGHRGSLHAANRPAGGADVWIELRAG
jgi:two-component system OmpR family sensor kinase